MQYKRDFYRHVYEGFVVVTWLGKRLDLARLSQGWWGRQARIDVKKDSAAMSGRLGHRPWPLLSLVSAQVAVGSPAVGH